LNSQNGTLYDGAVLPPGVVVPIKEGEPIAIGMSIIGLGEKCSERMAPVFGSVGITTEMTVESGIFQAHRNKTNQRKLELLYKVSKLFDENLPVNRILEEMLDHILDLLKNVDTAAFILVDPESGRILDVISGTTKPVDSRPTMYCANVVRQAIEEGRPLVVSDVETEEEVDVISTLKIQKIQSVLCVPLISHSHILGAIYVDSRRGAYEFSKADICLFEDLCNRAALFLVNAQWTAESTTTGYGFHPDVPPPS
jgi:transcriptional regulator with GAF, ATPase, and Fis domain